jgi:CBS domain containing-hemolysin-like protein
MTEPDRRDEDNRQRRGLFGLFGGRRREPEAGSEPVDPGQEEAEALVSQARAFDDLTVEDVMKPRADIVAVEKTCPFSELVAQFIETEHSRLPVFRETLDDPVGVVHVKDVFKLLARKVRKPRPTDQVLVGRHSLVREVIYVPPSMPAPDLMAEMRRKRTHMALVIDEFGGVDGLVTLEDLLEELVGEIGDEHDEAADYEPAPILRDEAGWVADGRTPLDELEAAIGGGVDLAPPDVDEEIETVAGLINTLAGRVPQRRETIPHPGGFDFEVLAADPRRVKRVRVRRAAGASD